MKGEAWYMRPGGAFLGANSPRTGIWYFCKEFCKEDAISPIPVLKCQCQGCMMVRTARYVWFLHTVTYYGVVVVTCNYHARQKPDKRSIPCGSLSWLPMIKTGRCKGASCMAEQMPDHAAQAVRLRAVD